MANDLHREIEVGERIVLRKSIFKPEYQGLATRVFVAESGNGMHSYTIGEGIFGRFECDGEHARFEGSDIDPKETAELQASASS